jgi:hypothetical protein
VIAHGLRIYVALEPVDMRLGAERLGALVRERMVTEPRSRALFVFRRQVRTEHEGPDVGWDGYDRSSRSSTPGSSNCRDRPRRASSTCW